MSEVAFLALEGLAKSYGSFQAVRALSLQLREGELLSLLGPSGCGKTTTLRMVGGFTAPDQGSIRIAGEDITKYPAEVRPTGMVFQRAALWPHMNVWHNVAFGLKIRRVPRPEIYRRVRETLELVGLPDSGKKYPPQLSGGQAQRIALARALVLRPKVLLLDEPFSNLDAQLRLRLREEVRSIQQLSGLTTLLVTHDQAEALAISDRIAVMESGEVLQECNPADLYTRPANLRVARFVGEMNVLKTELIGGALKLFGECARHHSLDALVDGPVTVAIRPEDLVLEPGQGARIESVSDLGHALQVHLQTAHGPVRAWTSRKTLRPGESVRPGAQRCLLYREDRLLLEISAREVSDAPST